MENRKKERSLLFSTFQDDFRGAPDKRRYHWKINKLRTGYGQTVNRKEPSKPAPFEFLSDLGLEMLLPLLQIRHFQAGETIWNQNDPCQFLFFVERGKIKITKRNDFNTNAIVMAVIGNGSLAGEFGLLEETHFTTTAMAMEHTLLGILDLDKFQGIFMDSPDLGIRLLKEMLNASSFQLRQSMERLIQLF